MSRNTKAGIALAVLLYMLAGFYAAQYVAGVVYFVANKTSPAPVQWDTWWRYWSAYKDQKSDRRKLQASAAMGAALIYLAPLIVIGALTSRRRSLHGDARFATGGEVRKAGLHADKGILVGRHNGRYLMFDGQQFVLLAAPTRSGKGVAIVLPNLLNYADSTVTLDIKLENFKLTSKFRAAHGQKVFLFNPFAEDGCTHCWNPLDGISRDRNFRVGDVLAVGQALFPSDHTKEAFWNEQARNLFLGLALFLLETPELPCTLGEMLRQSSGKGRPIKDHVQALMADRVTKENPLSDECTDALNRFCSTSENTMASILATFNAPLTIFANPIVDAATSTSDFDIRKVREERMSIYIGIQPNRLADAALLVNLFFSQLVDLNTKELPQNNPKLKYQCLLIMDEFTALGRVGPIAKSNAFIAGYNLRLLTIIQSISQLESVYGDKETRTLVTNHALQVLYPPREQKDANEYSEMLGYFTEKSLSTGTSSPRGAFFAGNSHPTASENLSDQRRALLLPQELKELDQDKEIIIAENTKPILCEKARYFNDAVFINRLKSISPTLAKLGTKLPNRAELERAAFVLNELAAPVPILDIDLHKAKMERRLRAAKPGEPIDIGRLALDSTELPPLDGENPSPAEVQDLVDAFFGCMDWADENGVVGQAPRRQPFDLSMLDDETGDSGGEISVVVNGVDWAALDRPANAEAGDAAARSVPGAMVAQGQQKRSVIDLAALDH